LTFTYLLTLDFAQPHNTVSSQCRTKSKIAEQNLQNIYIFCAALLILRTTANSAHFVEFCTELQNSHISTCKQL